MTGIESAARQTKPGQLFAVFERLSGQELRLSYVRQSSMAQLCSRGVTGTDIEQVWHFTKAMMSRGKCGFNELSLTFGAMLADPDKFEDRLAAARAWKRPAQGLAVSNRTTETVPAQTWDQAAWEAGAGARAEQRQSLLRKGAG